MAQKETAREAAPRTVRGGAPIVKSTTSRDLKDRILPAATDAPIVLIPATLAWTSWSYHLGLERGTGYVLLGLAGIVLGLISLILMAVFTSWMLADQRSLVNKGTRRLARRNGVAAAAADMIRCDWHRSTVTSAPGIGIGIKGVGAEIRTRSTDIVLPTGAVVKVVHRHDRTPLAFLDPDGRGIGRRAMGKAASLLIAAAVERRQIEALAMRLGVSETVSAESMSRIVATLATGNSHERVFKSHSALDKADKARRTYRLPADVEVTTVGERESTTVSECLVTAPEIGVLSLPTYGFGDEMRKAETERMEKAFGVHRGARSGMPMFIGNARATRLAELARRGLDEDPDLVADDGNRIGPLFEEHLPRLVDRHRASARTADTDDIARVDAELDRGLDIIARALGEALDRLADDRLDDLRTEVRFLEARHPDDARPRESLAPVEHEREG